MEKLESQKLSKLLSTLSCCLNILPYYDYAHKCSWLMLSTNSSTRKLWTENLQKMLDALAEVMTVIDTSIDNRVEVEKM